MRSIPLSLLALVVAAAPVLAEDAVVATLDTPRAFPEISTAAQWQERSRAIRQQILVDAGLWPMPQKTPLHPVVSDKVERDGYSVEKVYFQSFPGFYVAGNLYRPLGKGQGPFPGVLTPHGHWARGRLQDSEDCSIPGRCINFAKQGMVAFSYDMVGFNDTRFPELPADMSFGDRHHSFAQHGATNLLWNVTLMGLQTWDSIRALDFLAALPDVDPSRLACTGESGGGTQTFMLGAIDDRLAAQAPVVMVSHTMQGGCLCENMPGLRVEYSNMELAAAAAPRPQILVADNTDWTKTTMTVEGPAIARIYDLFKAPEKLRYVSFDAVHNYNRNSRQVVYQWLDRWLLSQPDEPVGEPAFQAEPDQNLVVFPEGKLPPDAVTENGLIDYLIKMHRDELKSISPTSKESLVKYKDIIKPAWAPTLQLTETKESRPLLQFAPVVPNPQRFRTVVVLAPQDGALGLFASQGHPIGLTQKLLDQGFEVAVAQYTSGTANPDQMGVLFTTYNRTHLQERVRDLVATCASVRKNKPEGCKVVLCGFGHAGLWALLAAPMADAVIADCAQLDVSDDRTLLDPDLFCPGLRDIDTFEGASILAAPHPLSLFNVGNGFPTDNIRAAYKALGAKGKFAMSSKSMGDSELVTALDKMKF